MEPSSTSLQKDIYNSVIRLLVKREYSRLELFNKLKAKYYDIDQIDSVLDNLVKSGYQNDERFTEAFIRYKVSTGKGPNSIRFELEKKGICNDIISTYLFSEEYDWRELSSNLYNKKFGSKPCLDAKDKAKRMRFMYSRGFDASDFSDLIN